MPSSSDHCYDNLIIDQGSAGVCWLASIIHAMFYSDGTRPMFRAKMQEIYDRTRDNVEVDVVDRTLLNAYNLYNTNRKVNANVEQQKGICINLPTVASSIVDITFDKCTPQVRKIMNTKVERNFFSAQANSKTILETGASSHLQLPRLLKWAGIYEKAKIYRFHNLCENHVIEKILNDGKECDLMVLTFNNSQTPPPTSITVNNTKYVLDACLLSSLREKQIGSPLLQANESSKRTMFEQMQKTNGHAIAGITCNGRRFVYNSWWSKVPTKTDWYGSAMLLSNDKNKMSIMSAQHIDTLCEIVTQRYRINKSYFYHLAGGTNTLIYVNTNLQHDNQFSLHLQPSPVEKLSIETLIKPQNAKCQCDTMDVDNDNSDQRNNNQSPKSLDYSDVNVDFIANTYVGSESHTFHYTLPVVRIVTDDDVIRITTKKSIEWLRSSKKDRLHYNFMYKVADEQKSLPEPYFTLYLKVNGITFELYRNEHAKVRVKRNNSALNQEHKLFVIAEGDLTPLEPMGRTNHNLFVYGSALSNSFVINRFETVYDLSIFRETHDGGRQQSTNPDKQYIFYRHKKYLIRKTSRNAMYILVFGAKKYLSSIKNITHQLN
jgi:hypothetical protein